MTVVMEAPATTRYGFTAQLGDLLAAVKAVEPGINKKPAVPVLAGVLLSAADDVVTMSTFDYEKSAQYVTDGAGHGRVLLPYATLKVLLTGAAKRGTKRITDGWMVGITPGGDGLATVAVEGSASSLTELPLDEYPELPSLLPEPFALVDTPALLRAAAASLVSVESGAQAAKVTPILAAVKFELEAGQLELLSTDRYRLTRAVVPVKSAAAWHALVPGATLKAWCRVLDKKTDTAISVSGDGALMWVTNGRVSYSQALMDGDYPKIRSLFPDTLNHEFVMAGDALLGAVASLAPLAEKNTPVRMRMGERADLDVGIGGGDHSAAQLATLDNYGDDVTVAFDPKLLLELVKDLKGGDVLMGLTNPNKPTVFQAVKDGERDDTVKHLLMPARLPA